jgi:hypothetical protein
MALLQMGMVVGRFLVRQILFVQGMQDFLLPRSSTVLYHKEVFSLQAVLNKAHRMPSKCPGVTLGRHVVS